MQGTGCWIRDGRFQMAEIQITLPLRLSSNLSVALTAGPSARMMNTLRPFRSLRPIHSRRAPRPARHRSARERRQDHTSSGTEPGALRDRDGADRGTESRSAPPRSSTPRRGSPRAIRPRPEHDGKPRGGPDGSPRRLGHAPDRRVQPGGSPPEARPALPGRRRPRRAGQGFLPARFRGRTGSPPTGLVGAVPTPHTPPRRGTVPRTPSIRNESGIPDRTPRRPSLLASNPRRNLPR